MDWSNIEQQLHEQGHSTIQNMLSPKECQHLISLYDDRHLYRKVIPMERYRFGKGEYKYFSYPLPLKITSLREMLYPPLARIANTWMRKLSLSREFPSEHHQLLSECKEHGQLRPTPLILRYDAGGYNTLHQDLYGEIFFPLQVVILLNEPGKDFEGGEFVMTEQVPRAQSKAEVITLQQGDALILTTNFRPVKSTRGHYRANMKHGVSKVRSGRRYSLGIIFHDGA